MSAVQAQTAAAIPPPPKVIQIYREVVKPGHGPSHARTEAGWPAARKIIQATHEKANLDEHWATFQVTSGAPTGTYLLLLPMKSMAALDAAQEMHGKAYAMGAENQKKVADLLNASVESSTATLFAFNPKMSYPSKEWIAADAYWAPKAERVATAAEKAKVPAKKQN